MEIKEFEEREETEDRNFLIQVLHHKTLALVAQLINSLLNSFDVDYTNYILTAPPCTG